MAVVTTQDNLIQYSADDVSKIIAGINTVSLLIDDRGVVLYINPLGVDQLDLHPGDQVFLEEDREKQAWTLRLAPRVENAIPPITVFAVSHFTWQDQPARLVILDDRKHMDEEYRSLLDRRRMLKTLVSNLPGMVYRCGMDPESPLEYVSEQCYELTGYPVGAVIQNHSVKFFDLVIEEDRERVRQETQTALEENRPYQLIYRIRSRHGLVKWIWDQGRGIYDQQGELTAREGIMIDATERQAAAEALLESESRYRSLVQASPDAVVLADLEGHILLCNYQFCQMVEAKSEGDLLGVQVMDFIDLKVRNKNTKSIIDSLKEPQPFIKLGSAISIQGKRIPIEANIAQVIDQYGKPHAFISIIRDVSQREIDQNTIRASEARYRAIVEDNPEMIVRYQPDGQVTFANATYCKYYNLESQALIGRKLTESLPEKASEVISSLLNYISPSMNPIEKEIFLTNSNGENRWYRWVTRPILDDAGQFIEYQSVGQDITDQKKIEEALRESESKLRDLLENVKLVALIMDTHGTVNFCNSYYCDLTGWQKENVLGQNWLEKFVPIDDAIALKKVLLESAITGSVPARYENLILTSQGEQRLIAWNNTIMRDSHGSVSGIASIGQDITERNFSEKIQAGIYKISQVVNEANDLDDLYKLIHQVLLELMPVDNFFIALYDQEKDIISFPYYLDQFDKAPEPSRPGHGLTEYVLHTGKSVLANPEVFNLLVEEGMVESVGTPSVDWLGVPLKVENRIIGVMGTQSYTEGIRYKSRDEQMFAFVSTQVAMAIDRKQAEEALMISQKRNQVLVEASTDAIFLVTMTGKILDCNLVAEQLYGYSREEFMDLPLMNVFPEEERDKNSRIFMQQMENNRYVLETVNQKHDGTRFPVEISSRLMTIEKDQVLVAYIRDITERKLVEKAIVKSEAKFRALAETAAAGIYIHRGEKFLYVNPKWCLITGFSAEELLDKNYGEIFLDQDGQSIYERTEQHLDENNAEQQFENQIITSSGKKRWLDITAGSIEFNGENAVIGTAVDITDRKQREHELKVIAQISETMRTGISRHEILPAVMEQLLDLLNVDGALIATFENGDTSVVTDHSVGNLKRLDGISLGRDEGLAGHIISTGEPYINHEAGSDPYFAFPELIHSMESIAGVPLITQEKTVGALLVCAGHHLEEFEQNLLITIGDMTVSALHRSDLYEQTHRQTMELQNAYEATLEGWALALELRDKETQGHSLRIANLTQELAVLMGVPEDKLESIRRGALLHDIGKMGIPDTILLKPGTLTDAEWKIMRKHPVYARDMLSQIPFFRESVDIPYCHHEWWDGSGYPQGLEGTEIPLVARIFAIVDSWDALTSNRPYRNAWSKDEALAHLVNQAGTHFDPQVVDAFVKLVKRQDSNFLNE